MSRSRKKCRAGIALCLLIALLSTAGWHQPVVVWAAANGSLQNGALTANADGWAITWEGTMQEDSAAGGYGFADGYLSIFTEETNVSSNISVSQTVDNVAAGSYQASVAIVGNGNQGASESVNALTLTMANTTAGTEKKVQLVTDGWDNWNNVVSTELLAVNEGDTLVITISGTLTGKDWYGLKNVTLTNTADIIEAPITVKKVDGLSENFIHGVDVSSYLSLVQSGVTYYDENGNEANLFEILENAGVNYVRLRVWNCPFRLDADGNYTYVEADGLTEHSASEVVDEAGIQNEVGFTEYYLEDGTKVYRKSYGAGICDVQTAAVIGKLATDHHMKVLIDFHYSDFWADPKKKSVPKAWDGMDLTTKGNALYDFTKESLETLRSAGVDVGMVQIGNEINNGMSGENDAANVYELLKRGSQAVREVSPDILIAVHFTDPQSEGYQLGRAAELDAAGVDYDVFGTSYYPFWHGTPEMLTQNLKEIADAYNKKVMVAEVSYVWTREDGDGYANVVSGTATDQTYNYSIDIEGQATAIRDTIAAVSAVGEKGIGTFYWEPAWVPVNVYDPSADNAADILAENERAWKVYGSGWGTIYANDYDPEIIDERNGGTWDNQAYFDFNGKALPSINVYKWVYTGAQGPTKVSTVDSAAYVMDYGEEAKLPETVNANLNDGTVIPVSVTWNAEETAALKTADFGEYTVNGTVGAFSYETRGEQVNVEAGTWTTTCAVTVTGTNYVFNGGFEENDGDGSGWTLTNYLGQDVGWPSVDKSSANAKSGLYYYKAWNEGPVDFAIDQTISGDIPTGYYMLFAYYQGTGVAALSPDSTLYAIVTYKDGTSKRYDASVEIHNVWKDFYQAKVKDIVIDDKVASVQVGTRLSCTATELGAWVLVDDISLMKAKDLEASETGKDEEGTEDQDSSEESGTTVNIPAQPQQPQQSQQPQQTSAVTAANETQNVNSAVNTGDHAPIVPALMLIAAAAGMIGAAFVRRNRVIS